MLRLIGLTTLLAASFGMQLASGAGFEAASLKPSKAGGGRGSMTIDATRLTYANVSVRDCVMSAWNVKAYQVEGPDWLSTDRYDLAATSAMPVEEDALKNMLQALLLERFHMKVHVETRELPVY
ncbi:MAG TPA: TIGR03435 family protein, partial [Bryobacteraceae bacterium]|nr:TIGR03435 family protein [Bryobacteraceae bacterium]